MKITNSLGQVLISEDDYKTMILNGKNCQEEEHDPIPVVKFFTPDSGATWLLTELDPENPDIAFGLCDLGIGFPELGAVCISEILALKGQLGLPVERDVHVTLDKPLSKYTEEASSRGYITTSF